jgi:hypothetical protein
MKVHGTPTRTIWPVAGADAVEIIDQTALPHSYRVLRLNSLDDVAQAIRSMQVRGAPLIGVSAAYGIALALSLRADDATLAGRLADAGRDAARRRSTCTGRWRACKPACCRYQPRRVLPPRGSRQAGIADEDVDQCRRIGAPRPAAFALVSAGWPSARDHDPLQCRLAGHRRSRHCAGAGLCRFRRGNRQPCLGFRNPPTQSGAADGLGAAAARRAAYRHRRQRCRSAAGARHDRRGDRRCRSHCRQRRRCEQGRHLAQGAGGAGSRRTVLRCRAALDDRLRLRERRRHPDRGARR